MKTLQELSFDKVAVSFDIYHHAYTETSNEVVKRGILFLQKIYSKDLIVHLIKKQLFKEKYANVLFNVYLKSLDTRWLAECSWETTLETFARIGPSLEKVYFAVDDDTDTRWKDVICYLPNVRIIDYPFCCFDEFLQEIAKYCPKLEELDLYKSYDLTDVGIKYLCQRKRGIKRNAKGNSDEYGKVACPLLKSIILKRSGVGRTGVQQLLRNQPLLEKVMHEELEKALHAMHKKNICSLDKISKRYNLREMNLSQFMEKDDIDIIWYPGNRRKRPPYTDIIYICFTLCPKLKSVHVPIMEPEHLNICAMLPVVENLMLEFVKGSSIDISSYLRERGETLKYLALFNGTVSLNVLQESCYNLDQLLVQGTVIHYNEGEPIPLFNSLKKIYIHDLSNSDSIQGICIILRSSPNLESLCLVNCESLPSEIKSEILKCCELLALTHTVFTGKFEFEFLKDVLLTCTTLKKMGVGYSHLEELHSFALTLPNRPEIIRNY